MSIREIANRLLNLNTLLIVAVLFLSACTAQPTAEPIDEAAIAQAAGEAAGEAVAEAVAALPTSEPLVVEITREVEVTRLVMVTATPTPTPEVTPTPVGYDITAAEVLTGLIESELPIGDHVVYTAETDPNELLGRPGGYTSKVNFYDTRLTPRNSDFAPSDGGSIEIWPDAAGAEGRAEYLKNIGQVFTPGVEYHFIAENVLLRLSHRLLPEQAAEYEAALLELLE